MTATTNGMTTEHLHNGTSGIETPPRIRFNFLAGNEDIVICALLFNEGFRTNHAAQIDPDLFSREPHVTFARLVLDRIARGESVDAESIAREAYDGGKFVHDDLLDELDQWADFGAFGQGRTVEALERLQRQRGLSDIEQTIRAAGDEISGNPYADPMVIAERMRERLAVVKPTRAAEATTLADLMKSDPADEPECVMRTGLDYVDAAIGGGLEQGDKLFSGGAPGVGKTTFGLQLASSFLMTNSDARVVWAAGEMPLRQLRNRLLMMISGLRIGLLKRPWAELSPLPAQEKRDAIETMHGFADRLSFIQAPLSIGAIEAQLVHTGASLCCIDYLQLIRVEGSANRRDEVDQAVREICRLAQQYGTRFYVISDEGKGGEPHQPRSIHTAFKESSEIEHAADYCYYGYDPTRRDEDDPPETVDIKWQCLKARNGERRSIWTRFDKSTQHFTEITP